MMPPCQECFLTTLLKTAFSVYLLTHHPTVSLHKNLLLTVTIILLYFIYIKHYYIILLYIIDYYVFYYPLIPLRPESSPGT